MESDERLLRALDALRQASRHASELDLDTWHFAVEIAVLRSLGLSDNDLRWLLCTERIQHATEITCPEDEARRFRSAGWGVFSSRSCFVLSDADGELRCAAQNARRNTAPAGAPCVVSPANGRGEGVRGEGVRSEGILAPVWDKDRRILRLGGHVVKQFKVPAPNQEVILTVFEEERWPPRIDDPLPAAPEIDPKRRLHDTINSLNRNQKSRLLRFLGDGSAQAIRWEVSPRLEGAAHKYLGRVPSTTCEAPNPKHAQNSKHE